MRNKNSNLKRFAIAAIVALVVLPAAMAATFRLSGGTLILPTACITDDAVSPTAAISAGKLLHSQKPSTNFQFVIGGTPTTKEETVFVASTAGTISGFHCFQTDTGTAASIAYDFKKNGTTVLSSAVTIANTDTDGQIKDGVLATTTFAPGDKFTISMTVSTSTGATGPFAWGELVESAP